jgi:hypothetical protein
LAAKQPIEDPLDEAAPHGGSTVAPIAAALELVFVLGAVVKRGNGNR